MISSRKEENVNNAVQKLVNEGLQVSGVVCHVGKQQDRKKLLDEVLIKNHKTKTYNSISDA